MSKWLKWLLVFSLVVAFVVVGYLRDFIAINLNYHLHHIQNQTEYSSAHSFFDFLNNLSFWQVYSAKYLLTVVFTLLNFGLGYLLLNLVIAQKSILKILIWKYIVVTAVALLFFGGGFLVGNSEGGYSFSRLLMGYLQSPVPAAILLFAFPLYRRSLHGEHSNG